LIHAGEHKGLCRRRLEQRRLKTAVAASARIQKESTLEKLLNAKHKECTRIHLKESEWKSSGGIASL
jgi:hypothetical protein